MLWSLIDNFKLEATDWGWKLDEEVITPVMTDHVVIILNQKKWHQNHQQRSLDVIAKYASLKFRTFLVLVYGKNDCINLIHCINVSIALSLSLHTYQRNKAVNNYPREREKSVKYFCNMYAVTRII